MAHPIERHFSCNADSGIVDYDFTTQLLESTPNYTKWAVAMDSRKSDITLYHDDEGEFTGYELGGDKLTEDETQYVMDALSSQETY